MCRCLSACSQERNILVIQQFIFNNEKMSLCFHNGGTSLCLSTHPQQYFLSIFFLNSHSLELESWLSSQQSCCSSREPEWSLVTNCNSSSCAPAALSGFGRLLHALARAWYTDTHAGSTAVHIKIKITFLKTKSLLIYWRRSMPQQVHERQKNNFDHSF